MVRVADAGASLSYLGYEAEVAADGPSALQAVLASQPDVVLLDIGLPNMDGWQVAKQIRELNGPKRPLLIAISGYAMQADRLRSKEAGIDLHLLKPANTVVLDSGAARHCVRYGRCWRIGQDDCQDGEAEPTRD
jgi:CheY-like chemotaxis protein